MRVAALDLGSNSFHLLVAEAKPDGGFVPILREKEMLRLGDVVARQGRLSQGAVDRAVSTVKRFRALAEANDADEIVAYGTAALREAVNGPEVVDRIEAETGVLVEIVSGAREARLIFEAVRASVLMEPAPVLCADLGGGSLELSIGDSSGLDYATSLHLGVGRLTAELVRSDPPTAKERKAIEQRVDQQLGAVTGEIRPRSPRQLIGTSGTLLAIARAAVAQQEGSPPASVNQLSVPAADILSFAELVFSLTVEKRALLPGVDNRRAELLPAGVVVATRLLALTGLDAVTMSEWALREGMVIDALGRHDRADLADDPRAIRRASVLSLCRRCDWREEHATAVAKLAVQLFDVTRPIHFAEEDDRELLEYAALLHDIGEHVAHEGHDRHSAYMIEHGGLRGFSPAEVSELISLARFHTRGRPRSDFPAYAALDGKRRKRVLQLLALLRMADGLDVSHREVVCSIEGQIDPDRVIFLASVSDDAELEQWIFRRKSALFEEVFGVEAVLELMLTGPAVSLFPIRAGEPEKPVGEDSERRRRTAGG